ncbi:hypothetical protein ACIMS1_004427 [Vibrio harveyi]
MKSWALLFLIFFSHISIAKDFYKLCLTEGMESIIENGALYEAIGNEDDFSCSELYETLNSSYQECSTVLNNNFKSMNQMSNELSYCLVISKFNNI